MTITPVKELVARARDEIETLTIEAAKNGVARGEMMLVDIRDIRELDREGRVAGAYHAPRGMLEFWFDPSSPYFKEKLAGPEKKVLFCASAWRSALAAKTLQDMGVTNVADLKGGFTAWRDAGEPVEKS